MAFRLNMGTRMENAMKFESNQRQFRMDETADDRAKRIRHLIEQTRKYRKKFPAGFKFDRYEANERR